MRDFHACSERSSRTCCFYFKVVKTGPVLIQWVCVWGGGLMFSFLYPWWVACCHPVAWRMVPGMTFALLPLSESTPWHVFLGGSAVTLSCKMTCSDLTGYLVAGAVFRVPVWQVTCYLCDWKNRLKCWCWMCTRLAFCRLRVRFTLVCTPSRRGTSEVCVWSCGSLGLNSEYCPWWSKAVPLPARASTRQLVPAHGSCSHFRLCYISRCVKVYVRVWWGRCRQTWSKEEQLSHSWEHFAWTGSVTVTKKKAIVDLKLKKRQERKSENKPKIKKKK